MKQFFLLLFLWVFFLAACSPQPPDETPRTALSGVAAATPAACLDQAYSAPALPDEIPGYLAVDPATGLHMTGNVQQVDLASYHLRVSGLVDNPLELTYADLRCMPVTRAEPELVCEGFFVDQAEWAGVPLAHILGLARVQPEAGELILVSADGYQVSVFLKDALGEENFLAYELNGEILPILHGFPLRAVFPGKTGNVWVKWLVEIEVR